MKSLIYLKRIALVFSLACGTPFQTLMAEPGDSSKSKARIPKECIQLPVAYLMAWVPQLAHEHGHALMYRMINGTSSSVVYGDGFLETFSDFTSQFQLSESEIKEVIESVGASSETFKQRIGSAVIQKCLRGLAHVRIGNTCFLTADPLAEGITLPHSDEQFQNQTVANFVAGPLAAGLVCGALLGGSRLLKKWNPQNKVLATGKRTLEKGLRCVDENPYARCAIYCQLLRSCLLQFIPYQYNDGYNIFGMLGVPERTLEKFSDAIAPVREMLDYATEAALVVGCCFGVWKIIKKSIFSKSKNKKESQEHGDHENK